MNQPKQKFNTEYWVNRLIAAGKLLNPDKYTAEYCTKLHRQWAKQPLTQLHYKVRKRLLEIEQLHNQSCQSTP